MYSPGSSFNFIVSTEEDGLRIDTLVAKRSNLSRTFIQELIALGMITINASTVKKNSAQVFSEQQITITIPDLYQSQDNRSNNPESLINSVKIIDEQNDFLIIEKPAGLITHAPHRKSQEPSIVDWLSLHGFQKGFIGLSARPGIVHRLDKETSGLMIIAKNRMSHETLSDLFKNRLIKKKYCAIVKGTPPPTLHIESFLLRDPISHIKIISVPYSHQTKTDNTLSSKLKHAISDVSIIEKLNGFSLVEVAPLTGRTHQIRVHLASVGYSIVGDQLYGLKSAHIGRHALHASALKFEYQNQVYWYKSPLPDDMNLLIEKIKKQN